MDDNLKLRQLRGSCAGRRCFVMGNGPSLKQMNLSFLQSESVWGANMCYLVFPQLSWRPRFYVARDPHVINNCQVEIGRMINQLKETKFFFPVWAKKNFPSGPNIYYFSDKEPRTDAARFSTDAAENVAASSTVTVTSLQLAVYLGFNPVYLIGCDMSYSRSSAASPGTLFKSSKTDPDHFDPRYLGEGKVWQTPDVDGMRRDYAVARQVCDKMGVEVRNATVGGSLEEFLRVRYDSLFKN